MTMKMKTAKMKTAKMKTAKKPKPRRPPLRVYVCVDALGVSFARETLEGALDVVAFGPMLIYKYRLIDDRPQRSIK